MVKHNPKAVLEPPETILEKIRDEIGKNNYLTALFLESSGMEAYLISLLSLSSNSKNNNVEKNAEDSVGRLGFNYLIAINNMLDNVDNQLYKALSKFYSGRNEIAHYLIGIDFNDPEVNNQVKSLTLNGLDLIKRLSTLHKIKLDSKSNQP